MYEGPDLQTYINQAVNSNSNISKATMPKINVFLLQRNARNNDGINLQKFWQGWRHLNDNKILENIPRD